MCDVNAARYAGVTKRPRLMREFGARALIPFDIVTARYAAFRTSSLSRALPLLSSFYRLVFARRIPAISRYYDAPPSAIDVRSTGDVWIDVLFSVKAKMTFAIVGISPDISNCRSVFSSCGLRTLILHSREERQKRFVHRLG